MNAPFYIFALLIGMILTVQVAVNSQLKVQLGHPVAAATISFIVGTIALFVYGLIFRISFWKPGVISASPWWVWVGGLLGAVYVASATFIAPKIGAGAWLAMLVCGQLIAAMIVDHFALIGFPQNPVTPLKLAGAVLLVCGVSLIVKS